MRGKMAANMSLDDRIQEVLKKHGWSARAWSRKAGLGEATVTAIRTRLREAGADADEVSGNVDTLKKLAKAAGVSYAWLTGENKEPKVERDDAEPPAGDLYPNRTLALKVLGARLHPGARDVVESTVPADGDKPIDAWLDLAKVWHRRAIEEERQLATIERDVAEREDEDAPKPDTAPEPARKPSRRPPPRV